MKITNEKFDNLMAEYYWLQYEHKFQWNITKEGDKNYIDLPTKENNILKMNTPNLFDPGYEYLLSSKLKELKNYFKQ